MKPELAWYLFLYQIWSRHVSHNFPMTFDKPIGRLATCGRRNDAGISCWGGEVSFDGFAEEFFVTVTAKAFSITARFSAEEIKIVTKVI